MSIAIDTDLVVGLYALGQWFKVEKGTLIFDAYEIIQRYSEDAEEIYSLGMAYPKFEPWSFRPNPEDYPKVVYMKPTPMTGCAWKDADSGDTFSLSLVEVKAWRFHR
jgi:hypothetical protein